MPFVDGLFFEPDGDYLFVTDRTETALTTADGLEHELNALLVVDRMGEIVQNLPMTSEPDGVSFHPPTAANPAQFVVTNNESNGTMTRFDFPDGYGLPPSQSTSAERIRQQRRSGDRHHLWGGHRDGRASR